MNESSQLFVHVQAWREFSWLRHGFSTRRGGVSTVYRAPDVNGGQPQDGDLNLGWTNDDAAANVIENRRSFVAAVCGTSSIAVPLVTVRQVHANQSLVVSGMAGDDISAYVSGEGRAIREADGLMTNAVNILLGIQTADCVPVLVADTRRRVVACFHAGWRGTVARIVDRGVAQMRLEYGCAVEDLTAAIGPSIGACCYSVGEAVYEEFLNAFRYGETLFSRRPDEDSRDLLHLDLWKANRRQLMDSGVSGNRIATVGECTGCAGLPGRRQYFSHRREDGFTGRMLSVIGVAEHPSK